MSRPRQSLSPELMCYELTPQDIEDLPSQLLMDENFVSAWRLYLEMRSRILKKPLSNYGARLALRKLVQHSDHADPVAVLNLSLERNYQGIFFTDESVQRRAEQGQRKSGLVL